MGFLKRLFRTRVRVISDGAGWYDIQYRYWWWPFYIHISHTTSKDVAISRASEFGVHYKN